MKILITGGQGQIGRDLQTVLSDEFEVVALGRELLDISRKEEIERVLLGQRPGLVVNTAAFTKVDACETQRELAWKVNGEAVGFLALACREKGISLLHLSTDYVFDGLKKISDSYSEEDQTGPLSIYGHSKLEGERQIQATGGDMVILRTAWVYGFHGENFLKAILRRALQGHELRVVNDQWGTPTWSYRIAIQARRLIREKTRGIYHGAAEGVANWYEVARYFLDLMQVDAKLSPCSTAEYPTPARRPVNSRLANQRLKLEGLAEMRDWREDLQVYVEQFRDRLIEKARV